MLETSTSPGPASDEMRAPVETAIPAILPSRDLALAGVETGADLDPECRERIADRGGGLDSAGRPVEGGEEPVTGGVELPPRNRASSRRTIA